MSLIPTVYRSTDPGAPVLSGTAGSFAALMDAVLVDGYGTGPDAKPGLGWVRAFSDGHKRAYQNSMADGGTGMFWRIDDSNAQYVLNSAFHTMSGIDAGTDAFANTSNAWPKSAAANSTSRQWYVVGNSRSIYFFVFTGATGTGGFGCFFVGDYQSIMPGYAFNFAITYSGNSTWGAAHAQSRLLRANEGGGTLMAARSYDGALVGSLLVTRQSLIGGMVFIGGSSSGALPYPYPGNTSMLSSRVCYYNSGYMFAFLPGLWAIEHNQAFTRFDVLSSFPGAPSHEVIVIEARSDTTNCQGLLELSAAWEY